MTLTANVAVFGVLCFIETSHLERDSVLTDSPRKQQPGSALERAKSAAAGLSHAALCIDNNTTL